VALACALARNAATASAISACSTDVRPSRLRKFAIDSTFSVADSSPISRLKSSDGAAVTRIAPRARQATIRESFETGSVR